MEDANRPNRQWKGKQGWQKNEGHERILIHYREKKGRKDRRCDRRLIESRLK